MAQLSIEEELRKAKQKVEMKEWRSNNRKAKKRVEDMIKKSREVKL